MNLAAVVAQLGDLPATFLREGTPFSQLAATEAQAFTDFTSAADAIVGSVSSFQSAQWGWLDVWGLLLGVPRNKDEGDPTYANRITGTIMAWVGTVPAIEQWGLLILGSRVTVTENLPSIGYIITLPNGVSAVQIAIFAASLNRVRPAGVPFTFNQLVGGLFLDTINFLGTWEMIGSYLDDGTASVAFTIPSSTLNAVPLLPDIYLTDPTLNLA